MLIVNKENFKQEVLNSDKPVLVDFYADWCGPCKMLMPIIEQISNEQSEIKICKVNVDENPELAGQYGVMTIPTLIAIKDGETVDVSVGVISKDAILNLFN